MIRVKRSRVVLGASVVGWGILSYWLAGCHSARMAVPKDLQSAATVMTCQGRGGFNERFEFGPYKITEVKRGWTKRTAWGLWRYEKSTTKQNYEFVLQTPTAQRWNGQAATGLKASDIQTEAWGGDLTIGIKSEQNLVVRLGQSGGASWTMVLNQNSNDDLMSGLLKSDQAVYTVYGTHKLAGSPMPLTDASGYILTRDGKNMAAVEVINDGAVWLSPALTSAEKEGLAAAATALLLFKDLAAK